MFQFPTSAFVTLCIHVTMTECLTRPGFPIRISTGQWLFAPLRSFSQLVTSFIAFWCQGIHPMLLVAWPLKLYMRRPTSSDFVSCGAHIPLYALLLGTHLSCITRIYSFYISNIFDWSDSQCQLHCNWFKVIVLTYQWVNFLRVACFQRKLLYVFQRISPFSHVTLITFYGNTYFNIYFYVFSSS